MTMNIVEMFVTFRKITC